MVARLLSSLLVGLMLMGPRQSVASASFDDAGADLIIKHPPERSTTILKIISNSLGRHPVLMSSTRQRGEWLLLADSPFRKSSITPYWEKISVIVAIQMQPDGKNRSYSVSIFPVLYLSERSNNTRNTRDWHMPSAREEYQYRAAIIKTIKESVLRACKRRGVHANIISCDI